MKVVAEICPTPILPYHELGSAVLRDFKFGVILKLFIKTQPEVYETTKFCNDFPLRLFVNKADPIPETARESPTITYQNQSISRSRVSPVDLPG